MNLNEMQREWLMRRAWQSAPEEACGFIIHDRFVEINNSHSYPYKAFLMSGPDILKAIGTNNLSDITAIWHTHPAGTTTPSAADAFAMKCGAIQSDWSYFIATKTDVTEWNPKDYSSKPTEFWEAFLV